MLRGMVDGGTPCCRGSAATSPIPTPRRARTRARRSSRCVSMLVDGIEPLSHEYAGHAHAAAVDELAAGPRRRARCKATTWPSSYGGPLERITLERSYHVATQDYDKDLIFESTIEFAYPGHRPMMLAIVASIPSPSSGALTIGPLSIHAYGLMIALGVIAGGVVARPPPGGEGSGHSRGRQLDGRVGGDRRRHRVAAVPRRHRLGARSRTTSAASRRSGAAVSASPAGSCSARSRRCGRSSGAASRRRSGSSPRRRRWRSPKPSADGATGGTRSCSASPPTCRGPLRIDADKIPAGYAAGHHVPPDVPLRVAVELRAVHRAVADRSPVQAAARAAVRDVRGRLLDRPILGRGSAHRSGAPSRWPAAQPVGGDRRRRHRAALYLLVDWQRHRGDPRRAPRSRSRRCRPTMWPQLATSRRMLLGEPEPEADEPDLRESLD